MTGEPERRECVRVTRAQGPLFAVVPRRWVIERMFARLGRCRRPSKDYEYLRVCSENVIYLTMAMLLVRLPRKISPLTGFSDVFWMALSGVELAGGGEVRGPSGVL